MDIQEWIKELNNDELRALAEAVEKERRERRRGTRTLTWNPEYRKWEKRAL